MLSNLSRTVDTFVSIAKTSSFVTISITGFGLFVILISSGSACQLSLTYNVLYEINMKKQNKKN